MLSPLQLKEHRFTKVSVETIPLGLPGKPCQVTTRLAWGKLGEEGRMWRVQLGVEFGNPDGREDCPYKGEAEVVGLFGVADAWPEAQVENLVRVNGASLLYSAVREMVLSITARASHGAFTLPTLSFAGEGTPKKLEPTKAPAARATKPKQAHGKEPVRSK